MCQKLSKPIIIPILGGINIQHHPLYNDKGNIQVARTQFLGMISQFQRHYTTHVF